MNNQPKILESVAFLLREVPETRHNQNLLAALYWQVIDGVKLSPEAARQLAQATSFESIVRAKRKLLEQERDHYGHSTSTDGSGSNTD